MGEYMILCDLWHWGFWPSNQDKPKPEATYSRQGIEWAKTSGQEVTVYSEAEYYSLKYKGQLEGMIIEGL